MLATFTSQSFAMVTDRKVVQNIYIDLGLSFGAIGSSIQNSAGNNLISLSSGLVSGSQLFGLSTHFGIEFHFPNKLYLATEIAGQANFGYNTLSSTAGNLTASLNNGANGFMQISHNLKIGISSSYEHFAAYVILGWGYMFSGAKIDAKYGMLVGHSMIFDNTVNYGTTPMYTLTGNINLSGFRFNYGIGMSYYLNNNFGFYAEFIATPPITYTAPITFASTLQLADLQRSFTLETFAINIGLKLRF